MGADTKIQWAHHTLNPWRGCTKATYEDTDGKTKLHPGCLHCYAEVDMSVQLHGIKWGKGQERRPKTEKGWLEPLRWARAAAKAGERHRVFCASLSDVLDAEVPDSMREPLWDAIRKTAIICAHCGKPHRSDKHDMWGPKADPGLDWLLLTKRPENWRLVPEDVRPLVWLGTSVSDQETADEWVPRLLQAEGFRYRFLSVEPLIGPVDLSSLLRKEMPVTDDTLDAPDGAVVEGMERSRSTWRRRHGIDWVIVGGESGPKARPCNVEWVRTIVRQCREAVVPCHVKQLGADARGSGVCRDCADDGPVCPNSGLPCDGLKDPKGGDWDEWPHDLRVRQFPGGAP